MKTNTLSPAKVTVRRAEERGLTNIGWLQSRHSFSFGQYFDPRHNGFRSLRVINDDRVAPSGGFGTHPHRDMEILSYVVSGQLEHRDSMGNGRIIGAGEVQAMSAGTGISHSEFNPSPTEAVHFYQIWLLPSQRGIKPTYSDWKPENADSGLTLLASPEGEGGLSIHQDARLYFGQLEAGEVHYQTREERGLWIQVIDGEVEVEGETLREGDGVSIENISQVTLRSASKSRFFLFDLA